TRGPEVWALWQEQTGAPKPDPEAVARTVLELKSYAEQFGGPRLQDPFQITTYLHLPSPTVLCLPVKVFVDDRPDLTAEEAAGVDDPDAIRPPTVEQFTTENLGPGLKVTSHGVLDADESGERDAYVAVRYAFKV